MPPEILLGGVIASLAGLIVALVWGVKTLVATISAQNANLQGSSQLNLDLVARVDVLTRELAQMKFDTLVSDRKIQALTQNVAEKDRVIAGLQAENTALNQLVEKLQARVVKLEATLEDRETEIKSIKKISSEHDQQYEQNNDE